MKWGTTSWMHILCVQEVVTPMYIMSYYIKWVTTSWTYGSSCQKSVGILSKFLYLVNIY